MDDDEEKKYINLSPPADDFDCEIAAVGEKYEFFTDFGEPCLYMNMIDKKYFNIDSDPPLSSTSSDEENEIKTLMSSKKNRKRKKITKLKENEVAYIDLESDCKANPRTKSDKQTCIMIPTDSESSLCITSSDEEIKIITDSEKKENKKKSFKAERRVVNYSDSESDNQEQPKAKKSKYVKPFAVNEYTCAVCKITMNGEATLNLHLNGRKHLKAYGSLQIPEVAKQSISSSIEPKIKKAKLHTSRYPPVPKGYLRKSSKEISFIQEKADKYNKAPITGLNKVIEIRCDEQVAYYCEQCNAICDGHSIMGHLTGFKHLFFSLQYIDFSLFNEYRHKKKIDIERKVYKRVDEYDRKYKRQLIKVLEDVPADSLTDPQPGPSWRNDDGIRPTNLCDKLQLKMSMLMKDIDAFKDDFHCIVCDVHLYSIGMWENHVGGKRHLKNKRKSLSEETSVNKYIHFPEEKSVLFEKLQNVQEPIAGLNFIRESQYCELVSYFCFVCGRRATKEEIIPHLITTKHRRNFLATMKRNGFENQLENIELVYAVSKRDKAIADECELVIQKYGSGKIQVFKYKKNG